MLATKIKEEMRRGPILKTIDVPHSVRTGNTGILKAEVPAPLF